jgi:hypothetical protein
MNLHGLVRGAIQSINPDITAQYQASTGSAQGANFKQVPAYAAAVPVRIQAQPLKPSDLKLIEALGMAGVFRSVHMFGLNQGITRPNQKGGDYLTFPQFPGMAAQPWLTVQVMEQWPEWCRVLVCLQTAGPAT